MHPKPDAALLQEWQDAGVAEVMMGLPDREEDQVLAFIERRVALTSQFA